MISAQSKCETCQWWEFDDDEYSNYASTGAGRCLKIPMFWNSTEWSKDGERRELKSDSLAFAQDGSDYYAFLLTLPIFGCIMHTPKEPTT